MIDLDALVSLRAVDRHGSVIAASEMLGYTPSAVSQQVKRLERQVGVPLLERVGRGVMLTGPGRQLVDDGSRLLGDLERIEAGLHRTAGTVAGHLRLAAFSTAVRGLVAPALRPLLDAHPELSLTVSEREPWDTVDLVAAGHVDVGLVHSWGDVPLAVPEHLTSTVVAQDVADVLAPADHPLAGRSRVTPRDLVDESWIATPEGTICRQWLLRMYDGTGRRARTWRTCRWSSRPTSRWCRPGWASPWSRGWAAASCPTAWSRCRRTTRCRPGRSPCCTGGQQLRRGWSPARRRRSPVAAARRAESAHLVPGQRAAASRPLSSALAGCTRGPRAVSAASRTSVSYGANSPYRRTASGRGSASSASRTATAT